MINCSESKNYLSEKARMTKASKVGFCKIKCSDCPLGMKNNGEGISCIQLEFQYPEKCIEIVQHWSNAHPKKTFLSEFLRHYPNAIVDDGMPRGVCPYALGLTKEHDCARSCSECWNQSID